MTDTPEPTHDGSLDHVIEAYLQYLEGTGPEPSLAQLTASQRAEAQELLALVDASWGSHLELPPLEDDPVAIALGFATQPIPVVIAGTRLKSVRQRNHLDVRQLSNAIAASGGGLGIAEIARLERQSATEVPADTAAALADALGVSLGEITDPSHVDGFVAWLYSADFDEAIAAWAAEQNREPDASARQARQRLLTAQRRSTGRAGRPEWHALLQAVLDAMR